MKFNKWTVGLAAAGIVTLPSLTQAVDANMVQTMAASTTLSGYVDVSAQWNLGTGNKNNPAYAYGGAGKADGFNLNVVDLALDKPLDETPWSAGYHVELWFGPDANTLATSQSGAKTISGTDSGEDSFSVTVPGSSSMFAIRQAYVTLRTPIGNGIDWKIGVFDTIVGYESTSSPNNPNFTRSYGYTVEPTTHEGILASYKICDVASVTAGVANTFGPGIGSRNTLFVEDTKVYMVGMTLTAPKSMGWLADSSMTVAYINGFNNAATAGNGDVSHLYAGFTMATPVTGLKAGFALDYRHEHDAVSGGADTWVYGLYGSYQATEKLSMHLRGEYVDDSVGVTTPQATPGGLFELTYTVQYDLWKNVLSRAELRWDHGTSSPAHYGDNGNLRDAVMLVANVAYKF